MRALLSRDGDLPRWMAWATARMTLAVLAYLWLPPALALLGVGEPHRGMVLVLAVLTGSYLAYGLRVNQRWLLNPQ